MMKRIGKNNIEGIGKRIGKNILEEIGKNMEVSKINSPNCKYKTPLIKIIKRKTIIR